MNRTGSSERASAITATLVDNRRRFVSFLAGRVDNAFDAEEILQSAFVKSIEKADSVQFGESVVAWFYRLLRNAVIDYYRHRDAERRALDRWADGSTETEVLGPDFERAVCQCVYRLLPMLKDHYAAMLRRIDLEGASIAQVALETSMTAKNIRVKLHRARAAMRRHLTLNCGDCCTSSHCLDCDCYRAAVSDKK